MLIHWVWLAQCGCVSDHVKMTLLSRFSDPERIYFAARGELEQTEGLTEEGMQSLSNKDLSGAQEILDRCLEKNIRLLTWQDAAYPERLKNIPDPPLVLYYKGNLPDFDREALIGVVGTRKASAYGLGIAKRLGYQIGACGGAVVSGAAFGIDSMAMSGALTAGACVVGVLGCGADVVYPASGRGLYADLERYGCILTEYPPGTPPVGYHFPRRNRIISGLSCGVLVVEAPKGSGALITARHAADQGRDVFVVPSNIDVDTGAGSNGLLRDGAIAVSCGWDVVGEYRYLFPEKLHPAGEGAMLQVYPDEVKAAHERREKPTAKVAQKPRSPKRAKEENPPIPQKDIDNPAQEPYIDLIQREKSLTPDERSIVEQLSRGRMLVDDLIDGSDLPAGAILASLTLLEVKGIVRRLPGRFVELSGEN